MFDYYGFGEKQHKELRTFSGKAVNCEVKKGKGEKIKIAIKPYTDIKEVFEVGDKLKGVKLEDV